MMKKTSAPESAPQGYASANAAYCQRVADLLRESQQRWLELGRRIYGEEAAHSLDALAPLRKTGNWQEMNHAAGEAARQQWQRQLEASQALTHAVLKEQALLAAGLSEALTTWLRDTAAAGQGLADTPLAQFWHTMSGQAANACAAMSEASQASERHPRQG